MPVFDESARRARPEDYQLLRAGHLHLFRHRGAADRTVADLAELGYEVVVAALTGCADDRMIREAVIGAVPGWPQGHGADNWPGFADGLTNLLLHRERQQVLMVLGGFDHAYRRCPTGTLAFLDLLASAARWHLLFGRRLICLIETMDPELQLPPRGAALVGWNRHEWHQPARSG